MFLGAKQQLFARCFARLLLHAEILGYQVRIGEVERSRKQAEANAKSGKGISNSLHVSRLAADIHLFKDGKYLTKTEDHRVLGEYWESLHPLCSWGGDFGDGNHYSMRHGGRR